MQRLARFAILSAATLLLASVASAQFRGGDNTPSAISGIIQNEADNKPLVRIKVQLNAPTGGVVDTQYTGSDGFFIFNKLPPGMYVLIVEIEGFKPYRESIELLGYPGVRVNLLLRPIPPEQSPVQGDVVSARELGLPGPAQEALQKGKDALFQKHDPAGSLPYFQRVLVAAPDFFEAYYFEGVAYMIRGQTKDAEDAFRTSVSISGDHFAEGDFALATLLGDQGHFEEAETIVRDGLKVQPNAWRGHYELARILLGLGRIPEAEQSALEARKLKSDFARLYVVLANIHLRLHKNEAVLEDVNTYLKLDPNGPYSTQARDIREKTESALGHSPASTNDHI